MSEQFSSEIFRIKTDIISIQKDIGHISLLCTKLSEMLEKVEKTSADLNHIIIVNTEKLTNHMKEDYLAHQSVDKRQGELRENIRLIFDKLTNMKEDMYLKLQEMLKEAKSTSDGKDDEIAVQNKELLKRLEVLEKWRWIIMGAIISVGILTTKIFPFLLALIKIAK